MNQSKAEYYYLQMRNERPPSIPEDGGHLVLYKSPNKVVTAPIISQRRDVFRRSNNNLLLWNVTDLTPFVTRLSEDDRDRPLGWSEKTCWFSFTPEQYDDYIEHDFFFVDCVADVRYRLKSQIYGWILPLKIVGFPDRDEWIRFNLGKRDPVDPDIPF